MGQTQVVKRLKAFEGLATGPLKDRVMKTGIAYGTIYGGKAVTEYNTGQVDVTKKTVKLPTSAAEAARCVGLVPILETHGQTDDANYDSYADDELLSYMTQGRMWCTSENAVTNKQKPVYVKKANGNLTQVFYLTVQDGAAVDKVYSFKVKGPDGTITTVSYTAVGVDETVVATAIAAIIDAITGISAAAVNTVITCTAANADERWQILELDSDDIVLTGETTPTTGTLGSIRSGAKDEQVITITLADTAAADKLYPVNVKKIDDATGTVTEYAIVHTASGAVEATEATAIAALLNAFDGLTAAAIDEVITCTADNLDETWIISGNADMTVADATSTDWARCDNFEIESYEEIDGVFLALVKVKG